jgi:hypothetical protein
MNANFPIVQTVEASSQPDRPSWIRTQLSTDAKRFVAITVTAFAVGATIGTTLAIALDLPPVLGVCHALPGVKK